MYWHYRALPKAPWFKTTLILLSTQHLTEYRGDHKILAHNKTWKSWALSCILFCLYIHSLPISSFLSRKSITALYIYCTLSLDILIWVFLLLIFEFLFYHFFFFLPRGITWYPSSLTRDRTRAPCIGSTESYPLDCQGSPRHCFPLGAVSAARFENPLCSLRHIWGKKPSNTSRLRIKSPSFPVYLWIYNVIAICWDYFYLVSF